MIVIPNNGKRDEGLFFLKKEFKLNNQRFFSYPPPCSPPQLLGSNQATATSCDQSPRKREDGEHQKDESLLLIRSVQLLVRPTMARLSAISQRALWSAMKALSRLAEDEQNAALILSRDFSGSGSSEAATRALISQHHQLALPKRAALTGWARRNASTSAQMAKISPPMAPASGVLPQFAPVRDRTIEFAAGTLKSCRK